MNKDDQQHSYGHLVGVDLPGYDYDLVARGLGVHAARVEDGSAPPAALHEALDHAPSLVEVLVSGEPTSPDFDSGLAEVYTRQALQKRHEAELSRLARSSISTTCQGS
jgi:thiamine pyrophosphate-dependent acetolactate synthase large subunit-like protein